MGRALCGPGLPPARVAEAGEDGHVGGRPAAEEGREGALVAPGRGRRTQARGGRRLAGDVVSPGAVPAAPHPDAAGRLPGRGPAGSRKRSSTPAERRPSPSALRTARAPLGPRLSAASRGSRGGQRQLPAPRLSREPLRGAAVSRAAPAGHREARPRAAGAVQAGSAPGREGAAAGGRWGAGLARHSAPARPRRQRVGRAQGLGAGPPCVRTPTLPSATRGSGDLSPLLAPVCNPLHGAVVMNRRAGTSLLGLVRGHRAEAHQLVSEERGGLSEVHSALCCPRASTSTGSGAEARFTRQCLQDKPADNVGVSEGEEEGPC